MVLLASEEAPMVCAHSEAGLDLHGRSPRRRWRTDCVSFFALSLVLLERLQLTHHLVYGSSVAQESSSGGRPTGRQSGGRPGGPPDCNSRDSTGRDHTPQEWRGLHSVASVHVVVELVLRFRDYRVSGVGEYGFYPAGVRKAHFLSPGGQLCFTSPPNPLSVKRRGGMCYHHVPRVAARRHHPHTARSRARRV